MRRWKRGNTEKPRNRWGGGGATPFTSRAELGLPRYKEFHTADRADLEGVFPSDMNHCLFQINVYVFVVMMDSICKGA